MLGTARRVRAEMEPSRLRRVRPAGPDGRPDPRLWNGGETRWPEDRDGGDGERTEFVPS